MKYPTTSYFLFLFLFLPLFSLKVKLNLENIYLFIPTRTPQRNQRSTSLFSDLILTSNKKFEQRITDALLLWNNRNWLHFTKRMSTNNKISHVWTGTNDICLLRHLELGRLTRDHRVLSIMFGEVAKTGPRVTLSTRRGNKGVEVISSIRVNLSRLVTTHTENVWTHHNPAENRFQHTLTRRNRFLDPSLLTYLSSSPRIVAR